MFYVLQHAAWVSLEFDMYAGHVSKSLAADDVVFDGTNQLRWNGRMNMQRIAFHPGRRTCLAIC